MINAAKVFDEMRRRDFREITSLSAFLLMRTPFNDRTRYQAKKPCGLILNSRIHSDVVVLSFDKPVVAVSSLNGYLLRLKR
ncbi:hypothetical protein AtNW77_Chr5g0126431 [Arabidopsis thaliana]